MKNFTFILVAVLLCVPMSISAQFRTQKEIEKSIKQKKKEYKKEGWIPLSSEPMEQMLRSHYERVNSYGGACVIYFGQSQSSASRNKLQHAKNFAKLAAYNDLAANVSAEINNELSESLYLDEYNVDSNVDKVKSVSSMKVTETVQGIMQESYAVYRNLKDGSVEVRIYYIVLNESVRTVKKRAIEKSLSELELEKSLESKILSNY